MLIEICTNSFRSAKIAATSGADRIELCQSLESGGLTPSAGDIKRSVALKSQFDFAVNVLIRPRNGDFCYNQEEYEVMLEDIGFCQESGVDGIVIGALLKDGSIDLDGLRKMIDAAGDMSLTFHRAFDLCLDPDAALKPISALGFDRILTSGRAPKAILGKENIKHWIDICGDELIIMPGSGINAENIQELVDFTGAKEVHLSAKETVESSFEGKQDLFELNYWQTQAQAIREVKSI
jgi:copper homeostasis protein